jgi:hypothetical protein
LFDFADLKNHADANDKRIDLPAQLRKDLGDRKSYDVVAFTHLDDDHVHGSSEFFHFDHASCYQSDDRIRIEELWVPAAAIIEDGLEDCARVIRQEARKRLREGWGIRVFSRPEQLRGWLENEGYTLDSRAHLITDAGTLVPGWNKGAEGVEFFVHSPFATRLNDNSVVDRNKDSLVLHGTFTVGGVETRVLFGADIEHEMLSDVVATTRYHGREERLESDIVKLPHHCSYLSLGPEKGEYSTKPTAEIAYLYEKKLNGNAILVSSSWPITSDDGDGQPPHRQAKQYYKDLVRLGGEFEVTMEHPTMRDPKPLVIEITANRGKIKRAIYSAASIVASAPAPRAG